MFAFRGEFGTSTLRISTRQSTKQHQNWEPPTTEHILLTD